ncbi:MAG: hypothetical protein ABI587_10980 [Gemmatimonadales bacterium]
MFSTRVTATILLSLLASGSLAAQATRSITVNRVRLTDAQITGFETRWQVKLQSGTYWYDRASGAWGNEGGPTAGWILPGQELGGPLPADISRGNTGVFINGRELPAQDVTALMQIVAVQRGRWWVDGQANFGAEGGPVLGNLWQLARQRGARPGQSWSLYANKGNNFIAGDENGCTYFNSRDMGNGTSTSWASPGC